MKKTLHSFALIKLNTVCLSNKSGEIFKFLKAIKIVKRIVFISDMKVYTKEH